MVWRHVHEAVIGDDSYEAVRGEEGADVLVVDIVYVALVGKQGRREG